MLIGALLFVCTAAGADAPQASLTGLSDLPGGRFASCAAAVSWDGQVVVGWGTAEGGTRGFRWKNGEMVALEDTSDGAVPIVAHAVSADGGVIVGLARTGEGTVAFRWESGRTAVLPVPVETPGHGDAWGVSADGNVAVGFVQARGQDRALAWEGGKVSLLSQPEGASSTHANAISADGATIAGYAQVPNGAIAVRWHGDELLQLGDLPGGERRSEARAVSANGGTIVGSAVSEFGIEGFLWREGAMQGLGSLSREHEFLNVTRGVSGDGAVIVGHAIDDRDASQAVVWDKVNGLRALTAVLAEFGAELAGWRLEAATGVSVDGTMIVGCGRNGQGDAEGWMVRLPAEWWRERLVVYAPSHAAGEPAKAATPRLGRGVGVHDGLVEPAGVAVGADGTTYIADAGRNGVRVIAGDGRERTWGSPGSGLRFTRPHDVAVSADGSVFVADTGAHRVQAISPDGRLRRFWGRLGSGPGEFCRPEGVAASAEQVFVADSGNDRVQVFDVRGTHVRTLGRFGRREGELADPADVAVGSKGQIYVADRGNDRVCVFDQAGQTVTCWGERGSSPGMFNRPGGVECAGGRVHVVDYGNHRVQVFAEDGTFLYAWGRQTLRPHEAGGRIFYPSRMALAPNLAAAVVCEPNEGRCQRFGMFDESRSPAREFGKLLDTSPLTHLGGALHIAHDVMVVTDVTADYVLVYRLTGDDPVLITKVANPGHGAAQLSDPEGLCLNSESGELLVADTGNRRIQEFTLRLPAEELNAFKPNLGRFVKTLSLPPRGGASQGQAPRDEPAATWRPDALARNRDGLLAVADRASGRILLLDRERANPAWTTEPADRDEPLDPVDLAFSRDGRRLFVLDGAASRVVVFDESGAYIGSWGTGEPGGEKPTLPGGIETGQDGAIYVSDRAGHCVRKFEESGALIREWGRKGIAAGEFVSPRGIAQDLRGRVYVNDFGNRRIQVFTADGEFLRAIGPPLTIHPTLSSDAN